MNKEIKITFRVTKEELKEIKQVCKKSKWTLSEFMRSATIILIEKLK